MGQKKKADVTESRAAEENRLAEHRKAVGNQPRRPEKEKSIACKAAPLKAGEIVRLKDDDYKVRGVHGGKVVLYLQAKGEKCLVTKSEEAVEKEKQA